MRAHPSFEREEIGVSLGSNVTPRLLLRPGTRHIRIRNQGVKFALNVMPLLRYLNILYRILGNSIIVFSRRECQLPDGRNSCALPCAPISFTIALDNHDEFNYYKRKEVLKGRPENVASFFYSEFTCCDISKIQEKQNRERSENEYRELN